MVDKTEVAGFSVSGISAILTTIQEDPTAQLILFIANLILVIATIIYTVIKIYKVVKSAKADGVITEEEKHKIKHTFKEGLLNILSKIKITKNKEDINGKDRETKKDD